MTTDRIVRKKERCQMAVMSDTSLDVLEAQGKFPRRRKISERIVAWSASEIQDWIDTRLANKEWNAEVFYSDKSRFPDGAPPLLLKPVKQAA